MSAEQIDFIADYALLGIDPGSGLDAVRQAYRRAVQRVHPDRAQTDADADAAAMVAINLAYGRLCAFHREYGRLPLEPVVGGGGAPRRPVPAPPVARRARTGVLALVLASAGAAAAWLLLATDAAHDPYGMPDATVLPLQTGAPDAAAVAAFDPVPRQAAATLDGIRIGDTAARVRRVLGPPILAERELWEYGPSHVRFERGRVVGWYSSPMKPLKIAEPAAMPHDEAGVR